MSVNNNRGVALMFALLITLLITAIVNEITYETNVDYIVNSQSINELKAYYAARAGVELSLLRVKIYNQVMQQFGKQLGSNSSTLDLIWNFPFAWPPIVPTEASVVDKDIIKKTIKESSMQATYITTITDEGTKIDVNDLGSPVKGLRDAARKQLEGIYKNKAENDREWGDQHRDVQIDTLINNIADWVSISSTSLNGGDKHAPYSDFKSDVFPPNRAFRTVKEVRMVAGMTDDLFALFEPSITVYGTRALNPNHAKKEVLMSIDPTITSEIADAVIKRRDDQNQGGPFQNDNDFWNFLSQKGARVDSETQKSLPLSFDSVSSFRIKSIGAFGKSTSQIEVIVFDLNRVATNIANKYNKENPPNTPPADPSKPDTDQPGPSGTTPPAQGPDSSKAAQPTISKGPPRVVYWSEQ